MNETRVFLEKVRPQSMGRELEVQLGGRGVLRDLLLMTLFIDQNLDTRGHVSTA